MPRNNRTSTPPSATSTSTLGSFESEFERLNSIVDRLENGSVTLEEMLKLYEEGVHLAGGLAKLLSEAELRVEKLSRVHEELTESEFEMDDSDPIETYLLE